MDKNIIYAFVVAGFFLLMLIIIVLNSIITSKRMKKIINFLQKLDNQIEPKQIGEKKEQDITEELKQIEEAKKRIEAKGYKVN